MKRKAAIYFLFLILASGTACEKGDPPLLSGDIAGIVSVYDENHYLLEDMSGVQISLSHENFLDETTTDTEGRFQFQDLDYGNYQLNLVKEGYVKSYRDYTLNHLGGYSPTMVEYRLHEIPKFETYIDSIHLDEANIRSYIYVQLTGLSGIPEVGYTFWCYFSDSPEVSKDQYHVRAIGWMHSTRLGGLLTEIQFEMWDNRFYELVSDSIFLCIYPRAWGRGIFYYDHYPESLGNASNVISFMAQ